MHNKIVQFLLRANMKCLATSGQDGVNVVPVSSLKVVDGNIWLFDYYMNRTVKNLKFDQKVSLAAWIGMKGYQFKGEAEYFINGDLYDQAVNVVAEEFGLDRVLKGLIVVSVTDIYYVSPGEDSLINLV